MFSTLAVYLAWIGAFTACRPLLLRSPQAVKRDSRRLRDRGGHHAAPRGRGGLHPSHCHTCAPRNCLILGRAWNLSPWDQAWSSKLKLSEQPFSPRFLPRLGSRGEGRAAESKVRTLLCALLFVLFCLSVGPPNLLADLFSLIYAYILFYNC